MPGPIALPPFGQADRRTVLRGAVAGAAITALGGFGGLTRPAGAAGATVRTYTGTIDGADFRVEVPATWNGTLLLYNHHYRFPGQPNPPLVVPSDDEIGPRLDGAELASILHARGYALAGSAFRSTGWAMRDALVDQARLLTWFSRHVDRPRCTLAWGVSAGGLASQILAERDRRIAGALSVGADASGVFNQMHIRMDFWHTVKTLLAGGGELQLDEIDDGLANLALGTEIVTSAVTGDALSRARLMLGAAVAAIPAQYDGHASEPVTDPDAAAAQLAWIAANAHGSITLGPGRLEMVERSGGNPWWNTGVDYRALFARSKHRELAERAYRQAGGDLAADLAALERAPRVRAHPRAVRYMLRNGGAVGFRTRVPVLTLHTTLDSGAPVEHEGTLAARVRRAGDAANLRQLYLRRGFTCTASPAELAEVLRALERRAKTGRWGDLRPETLNAAAAAYPDRQRRVYSFLDPDPDSPARWASLPPGFSRFRPGVLPRDPR